MLVLSRKNDESVVVGADDSLGGTVKVTVLEMGNGRVRLGFEANKAVPVHRAEVWERIQVNDRSEHPVKVPPKNHLRSRADSRLARPYAIGGIGGHRNAEITQVQE